MQRLLAAASIAAVVLTAGAAQAKSVKVQDCLAFAAGYGYFDKCEGTGDVPILEQRVRTYEPPRPPRGSGIPVPQAANDPRESRDGGGGGGGGGGAVAAVAAGAKLSARR